MFLVYVHVLGNAPGKRIGIVKLNESGYYVTDYDQAKFTPAQVEELVKLLNEGLGVPNNVAEAAFAGSMFGWHVPAAKAAIAFFATEKR